MGMYTEFFYRAELLKDTPEEVLTVLDYMVNSFDMDEKPTFEVPDHKLFTVTGRWEFMLRTYSAYFPQPATSLFTRKPGYGDFPTLAVHSNLKNYGSEIDLFCDWLDPYVDAYKGKFLGYSLYEEDDEPTLIFKQTDRPIKKWTGILR